MTVKWCSSLHVSLVSRKLRTTIIISHNLGRLGGQQSSKFKIDSAELLALLILQKKCTLHTHMDSPPELHHFQEITLG